VSLSTFVDGTIQETLQDLWLFRPELVLCGTLVLVLFARLVAWRRWQASFYIALAGVLTALGVALLYDGGFGDAASLPRQELFGGLLVFDSMTVFFRRLLLLFAVLLLLLLRITRIAHRPEGTDLLTLILGATLGFCLMASANHLLIVFLGIEMASVPSYVLAGMLKERRASSEAALKYAVYGAGAAGVMLYGISLLAGVLGTLHIPTIARQLVTQPMTPQTIMVLGLAGLMIMVGLAFKLSAVPFHFWCPDVFEGAPAEVNAFLSVASKAAALALLIRMAVGVGVTPADRPADHIVQSAAAVNAVRLAALETAAVAPVSRTVSLNGSARGVEWNEVDTHGESPQASPQSDTATKLLSAETIHHYLATLIGLLAAITCTFGNLAAYGQTNIKRMLAYSTIAHAGYMMMAVPAAIVLADTQPQFASTAIAALIFYIGVYLFMNLGAFAIVAFLRDAAATEQIADYAGLLRTAPVTILCFATVLISLIGIPPLAGFVGKFFLFAALVEAGGPLMIALLAIGGVNSVISLVYYLRVVRVMTMEPEPAGRHSLRLAPAPVVYTVAITLPVVLLGLYSSGLHDWARAAAAQLF
jgi:NADH-quinone oxidoreductase subunit N